MADIKTYQVQESELRAVTLPQQTRTYKPIAHGELIQLTRQTLDQEGLILKAESYSAAKDGKVANGRYQVGSLADNDMSVMIGWQNSYDKSITLKFAIGAHIFICSNGAISGDMGHFKKKHVGDIQEFTPEKMVEYIKGAGDTFAQMQKDRDRMKEIELSKKVQAELLGRLFIEEEKITATQLGIIKGQIDNPSFNYGADKSMWETYNHTTFALKETHPSLWMKQHIDVHEFYTKNFEPVKKDQVSLYIPEPVVTESQSLKWPL